MDTLRLAGSGREIDLYSWLSNKAKGHEALAGILGFGLPGVENFWYDGAGSGSTWRGARAERRTIELPMKVYAADRSELSELLSDLSVVLDPFRDRYDRGPSRLFFGGPDDYEWFVDVTRVGGGDWSRKTDSNDRTYFKTTLQLEAGDPFWTRNHPEEFVVTNQQGGPTLLPRFAKLRVSSAAAFGVQDVTNIGDTFAWPVFTIEGPTDHVLLVGPNGETVDWSGALALGQTLIVDMRASVVELATGVNKYTGLAPAPRFWSIAPGDSQVVVQADNTTNDTKILAQWWPRRWAVV